ncbi:MAG: methyltransferase domain-containing protein [Bryobacteraceae bacterium]|jgi:SAM-dependent methyltransferase
MTDDSAVALLRGFLAEAPLYFALVRSVECRLLLDAAPLTPPVLDLGCADGCLAGSAFARPPEVGLDPHLPSLLASRAHRFRVAADATRAPFRAESFSTIVANSVLEHIPGIDAAVSECARILRPGGRLLITAPSHRFTDGLLGAWFWRGYAGWFNRLSRHFHTDSIETWSQRLERHGLRVERSFYYFDRDAMRAFDLSHYLSLPRLASRRLLGCHRFLPDPLTGPIWAAWLAPHVSRALRDPQKGAYLFLDVRKP